MVVDLEARVKRLERVLRYTATDFVKMMQLSLSNRAKKCPGCTAERERTKVMRSNGTFEYKERYCDTEAKYHDAIVKASQLLAELEDSL